MKVSSLLFGILSSGIALLLSGCLEPTPQPLPQYTPKALETQGKGITIAKSTPYNCVILGEVEGKDSVGNTRGATRELLRESALNDLKNEAGNVVADGKRIMLAITKEKVTCYATLIGQANNTIDCTDGVPREALSASLESHRIHAQVFECGAR